MERQHCRVIILGSGPAWTTASLGALIVIGAIIRPGVAATLVPLGGALGGERFIRHVLRATDLGTSIVAAGRFISAAHTLRSACQAR